MEHIKFEMTVQIDDENGETLAAYLRIREGTVADTIELAEGRANADYDSSGVLLGIELLAPCEIEVLDRIGEKEPPPIRRFLKASPPRGLVLSPA